MPYTSQRWKQQERVVALILEGQRIPNNGEGQPDVIAGPLDVQVKTKLSMPAWFTHAVAQAVRDTSEGQQHATVFCVVNQGKKTKRYLVFDMDHLGIEVADE